MPLTALSIYGREGRDSEEQPQYYAWGKAVDRMYGGRANSPLTDEFSRWARRQGGAEGLLESVWNSPLARLLIPDKLSVSIGGDLAFGLGVGAQPVNLSILTRGKEPDAYLTPTFNTTVGITAKAEGSINFSAGYYTGDPRNISASMLRGVTHAGALSVKALGGGSIGGSWSNTGDGYGFINGNFGLGAGVGFSLEYQYQYTPGYGPLWQWKR